MILKLRKNTGNKDEAKVSVSGEVPAKGNGKGKGVGKLVEVPAASNGAKVKREKFVFIIAGGKGERFWPQSRLAKPKHLLPVVGEEALLRQTLRRVERICPRKNVFVITSRVQEAAVREVCKGLLLPENIVAEPVGRDTAAAVGLAAAIAGKRDAKGVFAVLPADHVIYDVKAYRTDLAAAFEAAAAEEVMVTIGIRPTEPATGFGYIQMGEAWRKFSGKGFYRVERFVEKPSLEVAEGYLRSGDFVWNAGMFVWSVKVVEEAFGKFAKELDAGLREIREGLTKGEKLVELLERTYGKLPRISVDYALLEKAENVVMMPASFDWDDVGAWPAVARHYKADARGNVVKGAVLVEDGSGNIVMSDGEHLVGVLGVDDLVVVQAGGVTLVCKKERAQDVKALLKRVEGMAEGARWL